MLLRSATGKVILVEFQTRGKLVHVFIMLWERAEGGLKFAVT